MNRNEFLQKLTRELSARGVGDVEEIAAQYEEHFAYKLADGYGEEEVAARLGDPAALAAQFASAGEGRAAGPRALALTMRALTDVFAGLFFTLLFAWVAVMGVLTLAFLAAGLCLLLGASPYGLIPAMSYGCAALFGVALLALSALTAVGALYFAAFTRRLAALYGHWRRDALSAFEGRAVAPPAAPRPFFPVRTARRLRKLAWAAASAFAVCMLAGYVVAAISAGALEFWHRWRWFV